MLNHMGSDRDDQFGLGRGLCLGGSKKWSQDGHILQVWNTPVLICRESLDDASDDHGRPILGKERRGHVAFIE